MATISGIIILFFTLAKPLNFNTLVLYDIFMIKAVFWSPWVGWEYYDMFFEHLYYDTQYQLNQMVPGDEFMDAYKPKVSPRIKKVSGAVNES